MRIDLPHSATPELEATRTAQANTAAVNRGGVGAPAEAGDRAELTTGSDAVAGYKASLNSVPEVRQQKVEALRQAVAAGTFEVSPERIADAMIKEQAGN